MIRRRLALLALSAVALGCSDWGPERKTLLIEPADTFFQPDVTPEGGLDDYSYEVSTRIDVIIRNLSDTTVYFRRCLASDTLPAFSLRRSNGAYSVLDEMRACASAPAFEIGPGESRPLSLISRTEFVCGVNNFCELWKPETWGYHRVELSTSTGTVSSSRFYLSSPFIFD
jgi:hypothetical protein